MFRAQVIVDTDVLEAMRDAAKRAPRAVDVFVNKTVKRDIGRRVLDAVSVTPGPPRYPIRWKSERQRRAYFATNGFGRGIPTQRTGTLIQSWRVDYTSRKNGGLLEAINDAPYARFVYAPDQQPFHSDTGWLGQNALDTIFIEASERATNMLIDGWYSIVEPGKGVRLI